MYVTPSTSIGRLAGGFLSSADGHRAQSLLILLCEVGGDGAGLLTGRRAVGGVDPGQDGKGDDRQHHGADDDLDQGEAGFGSGSAHREVHRPVGGGGLRALDDCGVRT